MVISTGRKKPHCRACGLPMEGHRRTRRGSPMCPSIPDTDDGSSRFDSEPPLAQSSPYTKPKIQYSPELSPRRACTPPIVQSKHSKARDTPSPRHALVIPESGPWHWRNPNFVEKIPPPPPRPPSPVDSLVPTVLVDSEGNTVQPEKSESKLGLRREETTSAAMLMDRLATIGKPAVSIFNTKLEDISRMKSAADRLGFHTGVVHKPSDSPLKGTVEKEEDENDLKVDVAFAKANKQRLEREKDYSWWLVLGQNKNAVDHVVDSQQRGIPGSIASTTELAEGPKIVTMFHLVVTGLIGGLFVLIGISMM